MISSVALLRPPVPQRAAASGRRTPRPASGRIWCFRSDEATVRGSSEVKEQAKVAVPSPLELRGSKNWASLIPQEGNDGQLTGVLHPDLRKMIVAYGELAQVTYDSFVSNTWSNSFGECRIGRPKDLLPTCLHADSQAKEREYFIPAAPTNGSGNGASKEASELFYIYADRGSYEIFRAPESSEAEYVEGTGAGMFQQGQSTEGQRNWIGYVCISEPGKDGKRDIVVAFRGTITGGEWHTNIFGDQMKDIDLGDGRAARAHAGFYDTYYIRTKGDAAAAVVWRAVKELLQAYPGEVGSITTTGHSLGGALATICALDLAKKLAKAKQEKQSYLPAEELSVMAVTFGAPRVGNPQFNRELAKRNVKLLRVVNKRDLVPMVPGLLALTAAKFIHAVDMIDNSMPAWMASKALDGLLQWLNSGLSVVPILQWWNYEHGGTRVLVTTDEMADNLPWWGGIKKLLSKDEAAAKPSEKLMRPLEWQDFGAKHNLEVYLYMVSQQHACASASPPLKRDERLLNKSDNCLNPEWLKKQEQDVPPSWYQPAVADVYRAFTDPQKGGANKLPSPMQAQQ